MSILLENQERTDPSTEPGQTGALIINADDWGRDRETTSRILQCFHRGAISSVSAMVFMQDSKRAAAAALERGIDAGLHLNFTTPFTRCPRELMERQREIARYLRWPRFGSVVYHPGLARSFEYVISAQRDEFCRLYGTALARLDGHHHMHLCANVVFGKLLPAGTIVRRNFSFQPGEKSFANRLYRRFVDRKLAERHGLTDYFFSLPPLEPAERLQRIFSLASRFVVEVETHPANSDEYEFLTGGGLSLQAKNISIASRFVDAQRKNHDEHHEEKRVVAGLR